jgi:hypothetical protein
MGLPEEALKLLREIGFLRIAKGVSFLAWLALPFWVWYIVLQFVGSGFFVLNVALVGIFWFIVEFVFIVAQTLFWRGHEFKIMKMVESRSAFFREPENIENAQNFKEDCRKFILPFTFHLPFSLSAISGFRIRSARFAFGRIESFYVAYSIATMLVTLRSEIWKLLVVLSSVFSTTIPLQLADWAVHNMWVLLGALWILSLYNDPLVSFLRKGKIYGKTKRGAFLAYVSSIYEVSSRIVFSVGRLFFVPTYIAERNRALMCDPFIDPLTLPRIIQKTMLNVEGKSCSVSRWGEDVGSESDIDEVKELVRKDRRSPSLLRFFMRLSDSKDVSRRIVEMQPITYTGIGQDRCVFLGHVLYNPVARIRQGRFYFDTKYLKNEFLLIYNEEVKNQRQIESRLPSQLDDLIRNLRLGTNEK